MFNEENTCVVVATGYVKDNRVVVVATGIG